MNFYEMLGIEASADFQSIKKAYYKKVKQCHPDLFNNSRQKEEEFKNLVVAFDILSDPVKKSSYDRKIGIDYQAAEESIFVQEYESTGDSIMDTPADDTLEELLVGNNPPPNTTLATLLLDLEKTLLFMTFREGKNLFYRGRYKDAFSFFARAVALSPNNIIYRYYLGKTYSLLNNFAQAKVHFRAAINIGNRRIPPQNLDRIHRDLDEVSRKHLPWWHAILSFFRPERPQRYLPPDEETIRETNRAIANLTKKSKKRLK